MRAALLVVAALLCSTGLPAQGGETPLGPSLIALHTKWFQAFDSGDGAAMDQLEMDNLMLVMPDGTVWAKKGPRAGKQPKVDPAPQRTLTEVTVRQFGTAAVLTGVLTTNTPLGTTREATTVVFFQKAEKWMIASVQWGQPPIVR